MNATKSLTSTVPIKCVVTHLIKNLIEEFRAPSKPHPRTRCIWDLEKEG